MVRFPTASGDGQGMLTVPPAPGPGVLPLPGFLDDIRPDLFDAAAAELVWQRTRTLAHLAAAPRS
jgi:hypothetical protein